MSTPLISMPLGDLLKKRRSLRRELMAQDQLRPVRISVLSGSTTTEIVNLLELWLLESGFHPTFQISEYGRYYDDPVHDPQALIDFGPELVYVHTSVLNITHFPGLHSTDDEVNACVENALNRFKEIWRSIEEKLGCIVVQNNFEFPPSALLGNLDVTLPGGHTHFIAQLNREFSSAARNNAKLMIQDLCSISARIGLERWFDMQRWFSYKIPITLEGSRAIAMSLSSTVRAIFGKTRKVLVLDLDNTLWGGVIGDDGPDRLQIGRESALAEAYTAFQEYCLSLRMKGVLLAVCSKNDDDIAKQGFRHPDSVLKVEHFSAFQANWEPKPENIERIARELNLGTDSFVFIDDNPAERAIVAAQVRGIAVPDVGDDVADFPSIIEAGRYFEQVAYTTEDVSRATLYAENLERARFEKQFADYGEYLASLEMSADISRFKPVYHDRIAQLTNKTNQFNLTTRRYTLAEIERIAADPSHIAIYGRLKDKFGDHGLVSVVVGRKDGDSLHLDLWLMSCRVLKRGLEQAMLDKLAEIAIADGLRNLNGVYLPSGKNKMVAEHYAALGFEPVESNDRIEIDGSRRWKLDLTQYITRNRFIKHSEP